MIQTAALTRRYGTLTAVADLTVDIPEGITGLVGANGAGKSTLIKMLLGLLPPSGGTARVLGHDVRTQGVAIRELVGYMPEHDCLPPDTSATEFVVHMARMSGLPRSAARERTADTLRHVGLYEERYRPIGGYSTGMKQRVKLAQALVHDPKLVFLDEPTNGLDPAGRDEMLGLIRKVGSEFGISVLVSSHLLGELERTCDHVVVIDGGQLLRSTSTADLTAAGQVLLVEVTERAEELVAQLRAGGHEAGQVGPLHIEVVLVDDGTYDAVLSAVARLDVGLIRLERPRHRMAELFAGAPGSPAPPPPPAQAGWGQPPPPQGGWGAPPQPPPQQGGWGAPPQPPPQQGGWGAPPQPPPQQGGWGAPPQPPPQQGGWGAPPQPPPQQGGWGAPPQPPPQQGGWGAPPPPPPGSGPPPPAPGGTWGQRS